jgi:hypothetical protein
MDIHIMVFPTYNQMLISSVFQSVIVHLVIMASEFWSWINMMNKWQLKQLPFHEGFRHCNSLFCWLIVCQSQSILLIGPLDSYTSVLWLIFSIILNVSFRYIQFKLHFISQMIFKIKKCHLCTFQHLDTRHLILFK